MSADRWSNCPWCAKRREIEIAKKREELAARWPTMEAEEAANAWRSLAVESDYPEETVREDWSVSFGENGVQFEYFASCQDCDFKIETSHVTPLPDVGSGVMRAASWLRQRLAPKGLSADGKIRADAMLLVLSEMEWQDETFGAARHMSTPDWLTLAAEEKGEVARAHVDHEGATRLVEEWAQLAALSHQAIEDLLRHATPAEVDAVFRDRRATKVRDLQEKTSKGRPGQVGGQE